MIVLEKVNVAQIMVHDFLPFCTFNTNLIAQISLHKLIIKNAIYAQKVKGFVFVEKNKPAAQAVGPDPSRCNSTTR